MAADLVVNNQLFPSLNGYCWVDMHALIQECDRLVSRTQVHVSAQLPCVHVVITITSYSYDVVVTCTSSTVCDVLAIASSSTSKFACMMGRVGTPVQRSMTTTVCH